MKKKILCALVCLTAVVGCAFGLAGCNKGNKEIITMCTESGFAPYEFKNVDASIIGLDVAIMSQACEDMGAKLKIKDMDFNNITSFVSGANNTVGAAGITISDDRLKKVDFSEAYAGSTLAIVSVNGKYNTIESLSGLKVGVQNGTTGDIALQKAKTSEGYKGIDENKKEKQIKISSSTQVKSVPAYDTLYTMLESNQIDAILMDKVPAQTLISVKANKSYKVVEVVDVESDDFGIAFKKGDEKIKAAVNAVIKKWKTTTIEGKSVLQCYHDYYEAYEKYVKKAGSKPVAPKGLKLSWNC